MENKIEVNRVRLTPLFGEDGEANMAGKDDGDGLQAIHDLIMSFCTSEGYANLYIGNEKEGIDLHRGADGSYTILIKQ